MKKEREGAHFGQRLQQGKNVLGSLEELLQVRGVVDEGDEAPQRGNLVRIILFGISPPFPFPFHLLIFLSPPEYHTDLLVSLSHQLGPAEEELQTRFPGSQVSITADDSERIL